MSKKATAKRFRVATSGPTIDGRELKAEWLTQAAAAYDRDVYSARINVEHMRGWTVDGPFGAFGDVLSLSTETRKDGRVELYAELLPNQRAIEANAADQKVYPSIEIIESFAGTGSAYMVGLALTDSPASTGVDRLTFSAQQIKEDATYSAKAFTALGAKAGAHAFGLANPLALDFTDSDEDDTTGAAAKVLEKFAALRDKFTARFKAGDKAAAALATEVADTIDAFATATADQLGLQDKRLAQLSADLKAAQAAGTQTATALQELRAQLSTTPEGGQRKPSTGGQTAAGALADY